MNILICGDYVPREQIASMMQAGDFSYLDEVKSLVANADFSVLNLEAPIVETEAKPIEKHGPNLLTTAKVVDSLKYAGIDMVTLANNHIMDYGESGLNQTISCLKSAGIKYVGIGKDLVDSQRIEYVKVKDKQVAIINCCEHEFSVATNAAAGANPLNPIAQYYAIKEARAHSDYVIVIVHGGHEYWQLPSPRMVETYRFFVDAGADAVVNHHQHCYSGYETYKGRPIIYGLGNLCFEYESKQNSVWNYGYAVMLSLDEAVSFKIYPYVQCDGNHKVSFLAEDAFDKEFNRLNEIISDADMLKKETEKYYGDSAKSVKLAFEPYNHKITKKLYMMGLLPSFIKGSKLRHIKNYILCESHKDKVSSILSL